MNACSFSWSRAGWLAWLAALCSASCGGSSSDPNPVPAPPVSITAGGYTLRVDPGTNDVRLLRGDTTLLDFPADGFELGTVAALDDTRNYDPYALVVPKALQPPPEGLAWLAVTRIAVTGQTDQALTLALTADGGKAATLDLSVKENGSFTGKLTPSADGAPIAYFRLRPRVDAKEGFYGLGEYFDSVNHRGKVRAMQIELEGSDESGYNQVHYPIPLVIGTRGWGLFVESYYPGVFSVAKDSDDLVEATFGTGLASKDGLTFHLFGADHPLDVTKLYYDVTAYPRVPAAWALGPWIWRDENKSQAQVEGDLQAMRDQDIPCSALWIDRPYATGVETWDFDPAKFSDAQAMIDKAHSLGFRLALWQSPYLDEKDPSTQALRDEATQKGYYPPKLGALTNKWGKPIDLTNPEAFQWWQDHIRRYTDMGIEGFKMDYGEDVVPGIASGRNEWKFADGSDERTMHARFQLYYHRVYAETLPQDGYFLLCRHGTFGDQANISVVWPGDLDATFATRFEKAQDQQGSPYTSVGGLPASLVAGLSLGPSGFPFYGADTGGYIHSPPDKELFARWCEQTALSTVMQSGNSADTVPWEADAATGYDAELLGWYKTYARLHLRLFPYEWTYAQNLAKDGRPIERALGLAYPELGVHPDDEYLFGDSLLVAPVLARGKTDRQVILPEGRFLDWWTGEAHDGNQTVTVQAPLGTLPLFLAEGGIVPMLRPTIDTTAPTDQPALVDSFATTPGVLYVRVAPGKASSFAVYDGAELSQERAAGKIALSSKDGSAFKLGVLFEVIGAGAKPSAVSDAGTALGEVGSLAALEAATSGWAYAADVGGSIYVKVPAGTHTVTVTIP